MSTTNKTKKDEKYVSPWQSEIDSIIEKVLNNKEFSYNINSDPVYEQYKSSYLKNAQRAMRDTVSSASALTGGYANSYAVTAGQQKYNDGLTSLKDITADLYDNAYERYSSQIDSYLDKLAQLRLLDEDNYERYYNDIRLEEEKAQNAIENAQWEREFALEKEIKQRELALKEESKNQGASSSSSSDDDFSPASATKYIDSLVKKGYSDVQIYRQLKNVYGDSKAFLSWAENVILPSGVKLWDIFKIDTNVSLSPQAPSSIVPRLSEYQWNILYDNYYDFKNFPFKHTYITTADASLLTKYKTYDKYLQAVMRGEVK
ncbi:MAG: hypothetical protein E7315_00540 [Clostridiales bacterium]|nr:hypothetical protein [Clostridiales bacterium]